MKRMKRFMDKKFPIFLSMTFFLTMSGLPGVTPYAKDVKFPIGDIVAKGAVRFEARDKVWKSIESSRFPIFERGKIKTEQETGIVTLTNKCRIEIDQNSTVSFEQMDRLYLSQGRVNFRIPSGNEMRVKVGGLTVKKPRIEQASAGATIVPVRNKDTIGSITLHSNGSVTIRNLQGSLSILNPDHVVIAALSSKESITIPSTMVSGKSNMMVAQAGEVRQSRTEVQNVLDQEWTYLGLNAIEWIAVGYAAALVGGLLYAFWPEGDKSESGATAVVPPPVCP
jgi:hypothetical protein